MTSLAALTCFTLPPSSRKKKEHFVNVAQQCVLEKRNQRQKGWLGAGINVTAALLICVKGGVGRRLCWLVRREKKCGRPAAVS